LADAPLPCAPVAVVRECLGKARDPVGGETIVETRPERIEGRELHLGVAGARQQPAGVAEAQVLAPVDVVTEVVADEAKDRAELLQVLARLVDGGREVIARPVAKLLDRVGGAARCDPAHPGLRLLLALQAIGPGGDGVVLVAVPALERGLSRRERGPGARDGTGCDSGRGVHARSLLRRAVGGERLVRIARVAGDVLAEPVGGIEFIARRLRLELDLCNYDSRQAALEHIDFDRE
jgi:hypothetical protein